MPTPGVLVLVGPRVGTEGEGQRGDKNIPSVVGKRTGCCCGCWLWSPGEADPRRATGGLQGWLPPRETKQDLQVWRAAEGGGSGSRAACGGHRGQGTRSVCGTMAPRSGGVTGLKEQGLGPSCGATFPWMGAVSWQGSCIQG